MVDTFDNDFKPSLEEIAGSLGGDIIGHDQILAPGPGHSPEDRSLTVKLTESNEDGFVCHSFAGDDWQVCKDYIKRQLNGGGRPQYTPGKSKPHGDHVAYYIYRNERGENHHRVEKTTTKNYFQCHWTGTAWADGAPEKTLPYRLPELLAADPVLPINFVEGEKDAEAAANLGLIATTLPNGATAKWTPELAERFRGRKIVIIPDNDVPGHTYLNNAAKQLRGVASEVRVLELPGLGSRLEKHGQDLSDWLLLEGNTPEKLRELLSAAPIWDPFSDTAVYEEEIKRLASLSLLQYEHERNEAAKRLGMRVKVLEAVVKAARPAAEDSKGQGRAFAMPDIEPWDSEVDGEELLDQTTKAISSYVVLPQNSAETLALWAQHTHCFKCFNITPRAAITSPTWQCGKTTLLDVLEHLVSRPLQAANVTASVVFRVVELASPTLLVDEADTFLKEDGELRGIMNTGHRRGGQVLRNVGDNHEPRIFSTWAPMAIAMIGKLPGTLSDRSIAVYLRRRQPTEMVKLFRHDRVGELDVLARKMARWALDHNEQLVNSDPDTGELFNRVADNWRPLFAIADIAGGCWPQRIREVANAVDKVTGEQAIQVRLLSDIMWILDGRPEKDEDGNVILRGTKTDRISSAGLVNQLVAIEGQPWAEWRRGSPLTQNGLSRLLDSFEIRSATIRFGTETAKGYYRAAFEDACARYLPPSPTVTPSQSNEINDLDDFQSVTDHPDVTVEKSQNPNNDGLVTAVTVENPLLGVRARNDGSTPGSEQPDRPKRAGRRRKAKRARIEL